MRIAIDARSLTNENRQRGIGIYLLNLLEGLASDHQNEYVLLTQRAKVKLTLPPKTTVMAVRAHPHPLLDRLISRYLVMPRLGRLDCQAFLQPDLSYGLPRAAYPRLATVYDFIDLDFPAPRSASLKQALGDLARRWLQRQKYRSLVAADGLIAISDFTRQELLRRFPMVADRPVTAIGLGVKPRFAQVARTQPDFETREPYLLYVGGGDERKNVGSLVRVFNDLRASDHDLQLVLVGGDFTNSRIAEQAELRQQIESSPFARDIIRPGFLPEDQAIWLYQHAVTLAFPSLAEGFGLELLEAMAAGCPVVCYDRSALPEVAGDAALLASDETAFKQNLQRLITDPKQRRAIIAKGRQQAKAYSWPKTAQATVKFISEVVRG